MATPDARAIGERFKATFYQTFDTNRGGLASLYAPQAVLTYEGTMVTGRDAIIQKLTSLPFQTIAHAVSTVDVQMTVDNGLIVCVVGQLKADNDPVHSFSETFYLKQIGDSLFICNDVFRLSLHHHA